MKSIHIIIYFMIVVFFFGCALNNSLIVATNMGNHKEIKRSLDNGVDINSKSVHGLTAIGHAVQQNNLDTVKYLYENGADLNIRHDYTGETILVSAVLRQQVEIVEYLISKGINKDVRLFNNSNVMPKYRNKNAFEIAQIVNNKSILNLFDNKINKNSNEKEVPTNYAKEISTKAQTTNTNTTRLDDSIKNNSVKLDDKKWALVIGIDKYEEQVDVNYAANSARSFILTAQNSLGVPKENIVSLLDEKATSGRVKSKIALMKELVEKGDTIYFYFAGHGVPGRDGKTYILPSDMSADTIHVEKALELDNIYQTLNSSEAKRIYAFIDSCFSGKDDSGKLVYKGVAPVMMVKNKQFSSNKLTVMTAGASDEFANQYEQEKQRLFGYYLIKGLSQKFENIDKLYEYVRKSVKRASLKIGLGYKQVPKMYKSK
ncbi:caspase family protein [Sulfurimonas sp.]|nr:caspase family protein [Sulfurimonas sp.]